MEIAYILLIGAGSFVCLAFSVLIFIAVMRAQCDVDVLDVCADRVEEGLMEILDENI